MLHSLGRVASDYQTGGAYCSESTGIQGDRLLSAVRTLCLDCVWGDSVETTLARIEASVWDTPIVKAWPSVQVWGAKAFPDEPSSAGLRWLFPGARFVYIFRNGIDVVFSMSKFHGFRDMSFRERCIFWAERVFKFEFLRQDGSAIAIRFEDFLNDPKDALSRIVSHLDLPQEEGPASLATNQLIHPLDRQTTYANARSVLTMRPPAHQDWSASERQVFCELCSEAMHVLGYEVPF